MNNSLTREQRIAIATKVINDHPSVIAFAPLLDRSEMKNPPPFVSNCEEVGDRLMRTQAMMKDTLYVLGWIVVTSVGPHEFTSFVSFPIKSDSLMQSEADFKTLVVTALNRNLDIVTECFPEEDD